MIEVTNHVMDVPVVRFHSQSLLNTDVGWLGLQFHYVKASFGRLKEAAGLPWSRLSKGLDSHCGGENVPYVLWSLG